MVGYGKQKLATVTGSIATLNPKEIEDIPAANLSSLLVGRMAGVSVGGIASGRPGTNTSIRVRINSSFSGGEAPLFVIDGFGRNPVDGQAAFDQLDPSEVENISILKDAAAAVYCMRGANGVVLVTTKRGGSGKAKLSYSGSYGLSEATRFPDLLSAYDHAVLVNEYMRLTQTPTYYNNNHFTPDELEAFKNLNYDWLSPSWQNSTTSRHTLNIRGGSLKLGYFGSSMVYMEIGNMPGTELNKYTLRFGLDAELTKDLSASVTFSSDRRKNERPYLDDDNDGEGMNATFGSLLLTPKWVPHYINDPLIGQDIS